MPLLFVSAAANGRGTVIVLPLPGRGNCAGEESSVLNGVVILFHNPECHAGSVEPSPSVQLEYPA